MSRFLLVVALAWPSAALAERTDVVVLKNGDRITGEVRELVRGRLRFKTDDSGTLYIEWDAIAELTAGGTFEVETVSAALFYGSLAPGVEEDMLAVVASDETTMLDLSEVVRVSLIKASFWGQFDGGFDLGVSFAQAKSATQYWLNFEALRTRPRGVVELSASSSFSDRSDVKRTARHLIEFVRRRTWVGPRFVFVSGKLESNDEVGIDLRSTVSGGVGWQVKKTNRAAANLLVGLAPNREEPSDDSPIVSGAPNPVEAAWNLDLLLGADASFFTYDYPETSIDVSLFVWPQLNNLGRVRAQLALAVKRELAKDLYWSVSLFGDFDNEPPNIVAEKLDYGVNMSFGYSF